MSDMLDRTTEMLRRLDARRRNVTLGSVSRGHTEDETRALCREVIRLIEELRRAAFPPTTATAGDVAAEREIARGIIKGILNDGGQIEDNTKFELIERIAAAIRARGPGVAGERPFAEIIGTDGKVHYRRPLGDPLIAEAERTPGYSVRIVTTETPPSAAAVSTEAGNEGGR